MSDLVRGAPPSTNVASGRAQNGGATRAAAGDGPTPSAPPRYLTPTDVMRERRAREARRAEEAAARLRQEEDTRRIQQEQAYAGAGDDNTRRQSARLGGSQPAQSYNIGGPSTASSSRRQENMPPSQTITSRTTARQSQSAMPEPRLSANAQRNRTEAYETLNIPAPAKPPEQASRNPPPVQPQQRPQPAAQPVQQPAPAQPSAAAVRSRFPNAFERWEDLSAKWEGVVSSFIHRMEENANELAGKPIDRQMSRQVDDLSRAGANLFHAVVELQRLRASSERKFQRWFFETRHEQEQAQERQAQLERQLEEERAARTTSSGSIEQVKAERIKAEELVKEMRRELQISKEEARRAWEELGRREQEERERTIALRSGEPTLIGGVQVVPMQGLPSRQGTVQRPQTRDGPTAGAGPTTMSGQPPQQRTPSRNTTTTSLDSPSEEGRQFSYRPDAGRASPAVTDPYTAEGSRQDRYNTPPRPTQPATSGAAMAAARAAAGGSGNVASPGRGQDPQQRYHQPSSTNPQIAGALPTPLRQGTADTQASYIPSNTSVAASEEEYHINPDGSYARDQQGRRIPFRQPLLPPQHEEPEEDLGEISEELSDEDDDHAADAERERMYAAQYRQQPQPSLPPSTNGGYQQPPRTAVSAPDYEGHGYDPSPPPAVTQAMTDWSSLTAPSLPPPADPQGQRHRHPTRLSDIIEEHTARTSPSRTSYGSNVLGASGIEPRIRQVARSEDEAEEIDIEGRERETGRRRAR